MRNNPRADLAAVLTHVDASIDRSLERLLALVRIPSVSIDPAHAVDCRACADWHVQDLQSIGFGASARDTPGHPIVVGHDRTAPDGSALFYGHYDVHPVDPIALWEHDPFIPFVDTRADGTRLIRGRGASDDKGQAMTFVEACRAWKEVTGRLPISVTVLIEGEAEAGTSDLSTFMADYASELHADIALICDAAMQDRMTPAIATPIDGHSSDEITVARRTISLPTADRVFRRACDALTAEWDHDIVIGGLDSPIPVTHAMNERLGMKAIVTGFALDADRRHASNESFDMERFRHGIRSWVRILHALAP